MVRRLLLRRVALGALVVLVVAAVGGYLVVRRGGSATGSSTPGEWTVDQAAAFDGYPVYWLGPEFEGLPLTTIIRDVADDRPGSAIPTAKDAFIIIYGTCTPPADGGCAPPVSLRIAPRCFEPPELLPAELGARTVRAARGGAERREINGTMLWSGEVAVNIYNSPTSTDTIIAALKPLNNLPEERSRLQAPDGSPCRQIMGRDRGRVLEGLTPKAKTPKAETPKADN